MASNIAIQISANIQQAVAGIQSVNQKLDQLQQESERSRKSFTVVSAGFAAITTAAGTVVNAIGAVVRAGQDLVTAFSAQELAERKLQTTLRATRNVIGMSVGELLELADAFSRASTYTDQEILAVEQMMIATRKISRETLPEATKAVLDMAAATGEDLTGAAQRLAQALSDPAGEIESLKEAGIQLSEEQKKNIQTVQEQNGIYEAQQILLEEVAGTYGDMAKAIADTDTGKLQQIKNVWEDIKEGLGEGLVNSISPALDQIYRQLCDISDWINGQNALTVASQYSPDLSEYSSEALRQARDAAKENLDKWEDWIFTDPKYIEEQKRAINNINSELSKRGYGPSEVRWIDETDEEPNVAQEAPASAPPLPPPPVIPSSSSSFGPTFGPPRASYDGWWEGYGGLLYKQDNQYGINAGLLTAQVGIGKEYAEAYERDQARLARGPVSVPPIGSAPRVVFDGYLTAADGTLYKPNNMLGIDTGMMVSMIGIGKQYADAAVAEEARQKALEEARKRSAGVKKITGGK